MTVNKPSPSERAKATDLALEEARLSELESKLDIILQRKSAKQIEDIIVQMRIG